MQNLKAQTMASQVIKPNMRNPPEAAQRMGQVLKPTIPISTERARSTSSTYPYQVALVCFRGEEDHILLKNTNKNKRRKEKKKDGR